MRKLIPFLLIVMGGSVSQAGEVIRFNRATVDPTQYSIKSTEQSHERIVQFHQAITEADKKNLRQAGLEVLGYLPEDSLVVTGDFSQLNEQNIPGLRAVMPYHADYKIHRGITTLTSFNNNPEVWVISTFREIDADHTVEAIQDMKTVELLRHGGRTVVVFAPRTELRALASLPGVEHVQMDPQFESLHMKALNGEASLSPMENEALSGFETGTKVMNFDAAWNRGFTGRGQVVAFADTGLDVGQMENLHPDFLNAVKVGQGFWSGGTSWEDPMGHGTHVAGSIAGRGSFSKGALRGGAYESMLVAQSMWSKMMNNIMPPTPISKMFDQAKAAGANAHSDSWGSPRSLGEYDAFAQQVDEWMFNNPDVLLIFAAGNSGVDMNKDGRIDENSIGSPATAKNCLSVGASENTVTTGGIQVPVNKLRAAKEVWSAEPIFSSLISDNINGLAMFSSRGPTRDGRIKPDVVAPGTNILSTKSLHPDAQDLWGRYNTHYVWSGGTSMSTPLVAGAVMVARQYVTEKMNVQNPSAALMKAVMMHTSVDMYPGQFGEIGKAKGQEILQRRPDSDQGYGRVDMDAVTSMDSKTQLIDEKAGVSAGQEKTYTVEVPANGKLLANLVYTDAPASPNSAQALVNDLDLVLVKPDGSRVEPGDRINNHEIIELSGLAAGTYTLIVKGNKVPQGKNGNQPYALIWTAQ